MHRWAIVVLIWGCGPAAAPALDEVVAGLLATDRRFGEAAAGSDLVTSLTATFAPDVVMTVPPDRLVSGLADVRAALEANPANPTSRVTWSPLRAGVSADGQHGFTYGYMTIVRAAGDTVPAKYVAYWVHGAEGWRVAAYKRTGAPARVQAFTAQPPSVPAARVDAAADSVVSRYAEELRAAEAAFSDSAQSGFAAAFRSHAAPDAAHSGGPADTAFRQGPESIAEGIATGGEPFPGQVTWGSSVVRVAASGDLGVSLGFIAFKASEADTAPRRVPFLTIWRRADPQSPWRYVIE